MKRTSQAGIDFCGGSVDRFEIEGGNFLEGEVGISRSKNAFLPILAGSLLLEGECRLGQTPHLRDVETFKKLLLNLGALVEVEDSWTKIKTDSLKSFSARYDIVKTMRASILVLGPLLARYGRAEVSLPGGCAIGSRPISYHLKGLAKLGAEINLESGYVQAKMRGKRLKGNRVTLDFPSVGATENLMMAASLAKGETVIENVACEPEVMDLADFINKAGGNILFNEKKKHISIEGVEILKGIDYTPIADRVEAATFLLAGLICRSPITIKDCEPAHLESILDFLKGRGCHFDLCGEKKEIAIKNQWDLKPGEVETGPYPDFPTDIQAQVMAFLCTIPGPSVIRENIFENRFMHVAELNRLGAKIRVKGKEALIQGGALLSGAPVMCTDLRAGAALVLAALGARGRTEISRIYHLDRGYEGIEKKLQALGADIHRITD